MQQILSKIKGNVQIVLILSCFVGDTPSFKNPAQNNKESGFTWFYRLLQKKACLKIFFFRGREISQRLYNIYSRACCKAPRSWISCWFSAFPSNPSREFMRFLKKIKIVQIYITRLAPNFFYTIKTFSVCLKTIKKILRFLNIFHRILIFLWKSNLMGGTLFWKFWSCIDHSWGYVRSYTKRGPNRFSRVDVYWIQTNRQTSKVYK